MPAKAVAKKSSVDQQSKKLNQPKNESGIKYSDKSPGQPQLVPIFEEIKKMLARYKKGTMKLLDGLDGKVALVSKKPDEIPGRKKDELWFAGALVQKGYVGCFYIKKFDKEIFSQIKEALAIGYKEWHQQGLI
jgi:hypothetical protein